MPSLSYVYAPSISKSSLTIPSLAQLVPYGVAFAAYRNIVISTLPTSEYIVTPTSSGARLTAKLFV